MTFMSRIWLCRSCLKFREPVVLALARRSASAGDAGRIFIGVAHEVSADWNKIDRVDDRHWRFPACDINTLNIPAIAALVKSTLVPIAQRI
jgi:hypothetical protein